MTKSKNTLPPRNVYTQAQIEVIRQRFPHEPTAAIAKALNRSSSSVSQKAYSLGLRKTKAFLGSDLSGRLSARDDRGKRTRFTKGQAAHNKGLRRPGWGPGRMKETQFKPGNRTGKAQELYVPIGTERLSRDGIRRRKVNDDMPLQRRWKSVHAITWEAHHGPIPNGHIVVFRNGDRTDMRIENLELVTRGENMRRNTYHNRYSKDIALAIQLRGALIRKINNQTRKANEEQDRRSA